MLAASPAAPVVQQEVLPELERRAAVAAERVAVREAFLAGDVGPEVAYPSLVTMPLGQPVVVSARLAELDRLAEARMAERLQPLGDVEDGLRKRWHDSRERALASEGRADDLERAALLGIRAVLSAHPDLTDAGLAAQELQWRAALSRFEDQADAQDATAVERARLAAMAAEEVGRLRALATSLRWQGARPGVVPPDLSADITRLEDPMAAPGAVQRLELALPFLVERGSVTEALVRYETEERLPQLQMLRAAADAERARAETMELPDEATLEAQRAERLAEVQAVKEVLRVLDDGPVGVAREQSESVRLEAAQLRLDAVDRCLERLRKPDKEAVLTAQQARAEAEAALAEAEDDKQQRIAQIKGSKATAVERAEAAQTLLATRRQDLEDLETGIEGLLQAGRDALANAERRTNLLSTTREADNSYNGLGVLVKRLRTSDAALGKVLATNEKNLAEFDRRSQKEGRSISEHSEWLIDVGADDGPVYAWAKAIQSEEKALEELQTIAIHERDVVMARLRDAVELRRALWPHVSLSARSRDANGVEELSQELQLLPPTVTSLVRERVAFLQGLPRQLLTFSGLRRVLTYAIGLLVLVALYGWSRRRAESWAMRAVWRVRGWRPELRPADLVGLKEPLVRAFRSASTFALFSLMWWIVSAEWIELGLILVALVSLSAYQAMLAVFDAVVVKPPGVRPSLVVLTEDAYDLARWTARMVLGWLLSRWWLGYLVWNVLGLDLAHRLLMGLFWAVAVVGILVGLNRWYAPLQARMARRNQASWVVRQLAQPVNVLLRIPWAAAMFVFFTAAGCVDAMYFLAERSSVGRALTFFNRFQMDRETSDVEPEPLSPELVGVLTDRAKNYGVYIERESVDGKLFTAVSGWRKEGRKGLVAMVGDRGEGKRTFLDHIEKRLGSGEENVGRYRLRKAVYSERAVLQWLGKATGVGDHPDVDAMVEALRKLPRGIHVVEQAHRTFCRTVGGFDGLTALLYVMNATSDHHLWLVGMHRPAWNYLAANAALVDVSVFRTVISLDPFTPSELRKLTLRRTEANGLSVDFSSLARSNPFGADPEVELERAISMFYRLLAEASGGNPRVALKLWSRCLTQDGEGQVHVSTGKALATNVHEDLKDNALFTLVALRQLDILTEPELVQITNLTAQAIRTTVRDLQARGLVERAGSQLYVPIRELAAVTRTLRRRHLLHLEGQ